ncbi:MAG: uncharacterized protein JWN44_5326 [Myxococcales bacterium]|nr:uncharacterized protein [Myxococcales bacterium]
MMLMVIDHAGAAYDSHHLHGDSARGWMPGTVLPAGEFLTRWITHLCAPTFVLLAGTSLALSSERRRNEPGQTAFIVKRGLFIAILDPTWMSFGFALFDIVIFQVLYAIGMSMVCMAFLRRLSSRTLLALAVAIQLFGECSKLVAPASQPWQGLWACLFVGGPVVRRLICAYPLMPWLSIMMVGWVLGRWISETRDRPSRSRALPMLLVGVGLLALFAVVRGIDGYGNWDLHRDSMSALQWMHVAKYPPSLAYTALELGLAFVLFALFLGLDEGDEPALLEPLALFGSTAFFFYLLHVHILGATMLALNHFAGLSRDTHGLLKTYVATAAIIVVLYPLCARYRRFKSAHPDGWTRYI